MRPDRTKTKIMICAIATPFHSTVYYPLRAIRRPPRVSKAPISSTHPSPANAAKYFSALSPPFKNTSVLSTTWYTNCSLSDVVSESDKTRAAKSACIHALSCDWTEHPFLRRIEACQVVPRWNRKRICCSSAKRSCNLVMGIDVWNELLEAEKNVGSEMPISAVPRHFLSWVRESVHSRTPSRGKMRSC